MPKLFSDLDLHGDVPPRVQPRLGEWGPTMVPTTRAKRRQRRLVAVVFAICVVVAVVAWWVLYWSMTGKGALL